MSAAAIPDRVAGNVTPRIISQRVVPSASAPSSRSAGTCMKSSRQMLATIGTTMIVRISPAVNRPVPVASDAPKMPMNPSLRCSHGSRWFARNGPRTRIPQRPRTTLGIAASISISEPTTPLTPFGASSVRYSAIPIASGAEISRAIRDEIAVP